MDFDVEGKPVVFLNREMKFRRPRKFKFSPATIFFAPNTFMFEGFLKYTAFMAIFFI